VSAGGRRPPYLIYVVCQKTANDAVPVSDRIPLARIKIEHGGYVKDGSRER
jgi:hypothetical protein